MLSHRQKRYAAIQAKWRDGGRQNCRGGHEKTDGSTIEGVMAKRRLHPESRDLLKAGGTDGLERQKGGGGGRRLDGCG